LCCLLAAPIAATEGALIAVLKNFPNAGAMSFMAAASAALLAAGVLAHYWDIYKTRSVRGISFIFVFVDWLGDVFSLVSVFFEPRLDIQGMVIYATELVLWLGVFACGAWFNLRPWLRARRLRRQSLTDKNNAELSEASITSKHSGSQGNTA
jgi:hypothetical protein